MKKTRLRYFVELMIVSEISMDFLSYIIEDQSMNYDGESVKTRRQIGVYASSTDGVSIV